MISGEDIRTFLKEWFKGKGYVFSVGYGRFDNTLEATMYDPERYTYHQYRIDYEKLKVMMDASQGSLLKELTEGLQASIDASYNHNFICSVTQKACRCDENGCRQRRAP
jgi:hypothetical protein